MTAKTTLNFDYRLVEQWVTDLWQLLGSSAQEAKLTAEHLVLANLNGHDSHGVQMIVPYIESWLQGGLQLNQAVKVLVDSGSILTLDGQCGMGQSVTHQAMAMAIERTQTNGLCLLGLRNSHHLGRVGHWAEQATSAGLCSIHLTNVRATPLVAPHGGAQARFVTNPVTIGIPGETIDRQGASRPPMILDFATSAIAAGKVRVVYNKQGSVPDGILIDAQGLPTNNPAALFEEPIGALLTAAGHKGSGLAIMCELLAAALLGEPTLRTETIPTNNAIINNMLAIVFDPARFGELPTFNQEIGEFSRWLKSSRPVPGTNEVLLPGEPERMTRELRSKAMPLDTGAVAVLDQAAAKALSHIGASGKLALLESLTQRQ